MLLKLTTCQFIEKSILKYGIHYWYDRVNYVNSRTDVEIGCPIHNKYFWQKADNHLQGKEGCPNCQNKGRPEKYNTQSFIEQATINHGIWFYYDRFIFNGLNEVGIFGCPKHGYYEMKASQHLRGFGCNDCGKESHNKQVTKTLEQFIIDARAVHGDRYQYHLFLYENALTNGIIVCPTHGPFPMTPNAHVNGEQGCKKCSIGFSKGELKIEDHLIKINELYIPQMTWHDCKNIKELPFDFYLPDYILVIEYDGYLHYGPSRRSGGEASFLRTQKHDAIKNKYCLDNNIPILRIPYWEKNIDSVIDTAIVIRKKQLYGS
jgi:hypothetical protein